MPAPAKPVKRAPAPSPSPADIADPVTADRLFNQSLAKGLAVLSAFNARRRTMTLSDIAAATGISKSSAQRLIHTLEQIGHVGRNPTTRRYQLTPRVMEIGFSYLSSDPLIDMANPFLAELATATGETCNLTEPIGAEMVYVARFISPKFVPIHMPIGSRIPMYCTSGGRAYLSALPEQEALSLLKSAPIVAHTAHTTTDVEQILSLLREFRRSGFSVNREELFLGELVFGAPVVDANGRPVGAVHVVAPTSRWNYDEAVRRLAPAVRECARSVSNAVRALQ